MPVDLSHPRRILPFAREHSRPTSTPASPEASGLATLGPTTGGQRAIQLRLDQHVVAQLAQLAKLHGATAGGKVQLDLTPGKQPAIVIDGVPHLLDLNPEPPHSEILRVSPASRNLEPIATISHRAVSRAESKVERMAKASLKLKANREKGEREKESKKAVLLDLVSSSSRASSHTRSRPSQLASSPPSRTASLGLGAPGTTSSSQPKHASRLIATGSKPPTSSSSFRIGKGALPASIATARANAVSTSSSSSTPSVSSSSNEVTPVGSPPRPPEPPAGAVVPLAVPIRQFSSSSNSSTTSSESGNKPLSSAVSNSSTLGTSPESIVVPLGSAHKLVLPNQDALGGGGGGGGEGGEARTTRKAGGGGVLKGKQSLKKEAKKSHGQNVSSTSDPTKGKGKQVEGDVSDDVDADGELDEEMAVVHETGEDDEGRSSANNAKKKRKLLNGLAAEGGALHRDKEKGRSPNRDKTNHIKTIVQKVSLTTASEEEGKHSAKPDQRRDEPIGKDRDRGRERAREKDTAHEPERTKKRKKQETSRWYSSDSDDADAPGDVDETIRVRVTPVDNKQPRSHAEAPAALPRPPPPPAPPSTLSISSPQSNGSSRARFYELYAPYAVLHSRLSSIRASLSLGQAVKESPKQLNALVEECAQRRTELVKLRDSLRRR